MTYLLLTLSESGSKIRVASEQIEYYRHDLSSDGSQISLPGGMIAVREPPEHLDTMLIETYHFIKSL